MTTYSGKASALSRLHQTMTLSADEPSPDVHLFDEATGRYHTVAADPTADAALSGTVSALPAMLPHHGYAPLGHVLAVVEHMDRHADDSTRTALDLRPWQDLPTTGQTHAPQFGPKVEPRDGTMGPRRDANGNRLPDIVAGRYTAVEVVTWDGKDHTIPVATDGPARQAGDTTTNRAVLAARAARGAGRRLPGGDVKVAVGPALMSTGAWFAKAPKPHHAKATAHVPEPLAQVEQAGQPYGIREDMLAMAHTLAAWSGRTVAEVVAEWPTVAQPIAWDKEDRIYRYATPRATVTAKARTAKADKRDAALLPDEREARTRASRSTVVGRLTRSKVAAIAKARREGDHATATALRAELLTLTTA